MKRLASPTRSLLLATCAVGTLSSSSCQPGAAIDLDGWLGTPPARVLLRVDAAEAAAVDDVVRLGERAVAALPGVISVRTVACPVGAGLLVSLRQDAVGDDPARAALDAVEAARSEAPAEVRAMRLHSEALAPDIAVIAVKRDAAHPDTGAVALRQWTDTVLVPWLEQVPGVYAVAVSGGAVERQVQLDPERLLAAGVTVPEVLAAVASASSLDKAVVKSRGSLNIRVGDVATVQETPAGEPLRRDGGIEVIVRGVAATGAIAAALRAATSATPPPGRAVLLDADSVEVLHVLVSRKGGPLTAEVRAAVDAATDDVAAAALSVPGVHAFRRPRRLALTLDRRRLERAGFDARTLDDATRVSQVATTGLMVKTSGGEVRVVLGTVATPEALMRTTVGTRQTSSGPQPVRLFDVARATMVEEDRRDRVDYKEARRLRLSIDVGARATALRALDERLSAIAAARPGIDIRLERDREAAPLERVCP